MRVEAKKVSYLAIISLIAVVISISGQIYFIIENTDSDYFKLFLTALAALLGFLVALTIYLFANKRIKQFEERLGGLQVFLSYSMKDRIIASKLEERLEKDGIQVIDLRDEINIGDNISDIFEHLNRDPSQLILLISDKKSESHHLSKELRYALDHKIKILPIATTDKVNLPTELKDIKALFIKESFDDVYSQLIKAMKANIEKKHLSNETSIEGKDQEFQEVSSKATSAS